VVNLFKGPNQIENIADVMARLVGANAACWLPIGCSAAAACKPWGSAALAVAHSWRVAAALCRTAYSVGACCTK
jgi:hypothetical protein